MPHVSRLPIDRRRRTRRRWRSHALLTALLGWALAAPAQDSLPAPFAAEQLGEAPLLAIGPVEYSPGRGLRLDQTGLAIGGFTNVKAEYSQQARAELSLELLNVFVIVDAGPRLRAVAELQMKDIFVANAAGAGTQDFAFDVRRLFGDVTVADTLHLRAGTFLTPIGHWNLILAPPLTWTTEPPLIVEDTFFQPTTTGAMAYGATELGRGLLNYALFSQFLAPLADDPELDPADLSAGARLVYDDAPAWSAGLTFQAAENRDAWTYLGAAHAVWEPRWGEVLAEGYAQGGDAQRSAQWGTYVQGAIAVWGPFYAVGRYEHYAPPSPAAAVDLLTGGAVARPFPFMAVKLEYRFADRDLDDVNLNGVFASFTTFF